MENIKDNEIGFELFPSQNGKIDIILEMSENAVVGFSEHCIYEAMNLERRGRSHWHIDQLGFIPGDKNQTFGFFITKDSPQLVIDITYKDNVTVSSIPADIINVNTAQMPFRINGDNIMNIIVLKDGVNINENLAYLQILFTNQSMQKFGEFLAKESKNYVTEKNLTLEGAMGLKLANVDLNISIIMKDLGIITDYDELLKI